MMGQSYPIYACTRANLAHLDDLKCFALDSKIYVLAINETKIDSSVNDNEIYLPGFEVVGKDRSVNGRSGGGVCRYWKNFRITPYIYYACRIINYVCALLFLKTIATPLGIEYIH